MSKLYGLHKRKNSQYWSTNHTIAGTDIRLRVSTGEIDYDEAVKWTEDEIRKIRKELVHGERPAFSVSQAAARYIEEYEGTRLNEAIRHTDLLVEYMGYLPLEEAYLNKYSSKRKDGSPEIIKMIDQRKLDGKKANTINRTLEILRRMIQLAAFEWRHNGKTWLQKPNLIRLLPLDDVTPSDFLDWENQLKLMKMLPDLNADMIQYKVNTGCRMQEVVRLRWDWEQEVLGLDRPVFICPPYDEDGEKITKSGKPRVVVLNDLALEVINKRRGRSDVYVFAKSDGKPFTTMYTTAFKNAKKKLDLGKVTIHGLKRTFGNRLRNVEVSEDDIADLLAHATRNMSHRYTKVSEGNIHVPTLKRLIKATNKIMTSDDYLASHKEQPNKSAPDNVISIPKL